MGFLNTPLTRLTGKVAAGAYDAVKSKEARARTLESVNRRAEERRKQAELEAARKRREREAREKMNTERRKKREAEFMAKEAAKSWNKPKERGFMGGDTLSEAPGIARSAVNKAYTYGTEAAEVGKDVAAGVKGGVTSSVYGTLAGMTDTLASAVDLSDDAVILGLKPLKGHTEGIQKWLHSYANDMREGAAIVNENLGVNDSKTAQIAAEFTDTGLNMLQLFAGGAGNVMKMNAAQSAIAAGNSYMEVKDAGKGKGQAALTGALHGVLNFYANKIGVEGVMEKGAMGKISNRIMSHVGELPKALSVPLRMAIGGAGETTEELVQQGVDGAIDYVSIGKPMPTRDDYIKTAIMTFIFGSGANGIYQAAHHKSKLNMVEKMVEGGVDPDTALKAVSELDKRLLSSMKDMDLMDKEKMAGLKGLNKGTPGIDFPAPISENAPTVTPPGTFDETTARDVKTAEKEAALAQAKRDTFKRKMWDEDFITETYGKDSDAVMEAAANMWSVLDAAEAGSRFATPIEGSYDLQWHRTPSMFPQWVEPRLRRKKLFDSYAEKLGTDEKFTPREADLHDAIMERLDTELSAQGVDLFKDVVPTENNATRRGGIYGRKIADKIINTHIPTKIEKIKAKAFSQRVKDKLKADVRLDKKNKKIMSLKDKAKAAAYNRQQIKNYLMTKLPRSERGRVSQLTDLKDASNYKSVKKALDKIDAVAEKYETNVYYDKIGKILDLSKQKKSQSGMLEKKMPIESQKLLDEARERFKAKGRSEIEIAGEIDELLAPYRDNNEDIPGEVYDKMAIIRATGYGEKAGSRAMKQAFKELEYIYKNGRSMMRDEVEAKRKRRKALAEETIERTLRGEELNKGVLTGNVDPKKRVGKNAVKRSLGKVQDFFSATEDMYGGALSSFQKAVGEGHLYDKIAYEFNNAREKQLKIEADTYANAYNTYKEAGNFKTKGEVEKALKQDKKVNMKIKLGGIEYDVSQMKLATLWGLHVSKDPTIQDHLKNANKITDADWKKVENVISDRAKKYGETASEKIFKPIRDVILEQYERDTGKTLADREGYLRIAKQKSSSNVEDINMLDGEGMAGSLVTTPNTVKALTGDRSPLKLYDLHTEAIVAGKRAANYAANTEFAKDLKSIAYNPEVAAAMKQKGKAGALTAFRNGIDDLIRGDVRRDHGKISNVALGIQKRYVGATMNANIMSSLGQTTSAGAALAYNGLSAKELAVGMKNAKKNFKKTKRKFMDNILIKDRMTQGSAMEHSLYLSDKFSVDKTTGDIVRGKATMFMRGDIVGFLGATMPVYEGLKAKYKSEGKSDAYAEKWAFAKALDFGFRVQQDRSSMYNPRFKADSVVGQVMGTFKTSLASQARTMINDVRSAMRGDISKGAAVRSILTYGVGLRFLYNLARREGSKEMMEEFTKGDKIFTETLKLFPIVGDIAASAITAGGTKGGKMAKLGAFVNGIVPTAGLVSHGLGVQKGVDKFIDEPSIDSAVEAGIDTAALAMELTGKGAASQFKKTAHGAKDLITGETKDPRRLVMSGGQYGLGSREYLGESVKNDNLYELSKNETLSKEDYKKVQVQIVEDLKSGKLTKKKAKSKLHTLRLRQENSIKVDKGVALIKAGDLKSQLKVMLKSDGISINNRKAIVKRLMDDGTISKSTGEKLLDVLKNK